MIISWNYDDVYQSQLYFPGWAFAETWTGNTGAAVAVKPRRLLPILGVGR